VKTASLLSTLWLARYLARPERLELPTLWFEARCSIQLSYGRANFIIAAFWRANSQKKAVRRSIHAIGCIVETSSGISIRIKVPWPVWLSICN
jgi:hypothetical protein